MFDESFQRISKEKYEIYVLIVITVSIYDVMILFEDFFFIKGKESTKNKQTSQLLNF